MIVDRSALRRLPRLEAIRYTQELSEQRLQAQRSVTDPVADRVIAELRKTQPIRDIDAMLKTVRARAASEGGVYAEFVAACDDVPEWADFDQMRSGQRLIASYGPFVGLSLLTGSLVGGYVFKKMSMVTALTGRLGVPGDISRRLQETAALVFYMSFEGEVEPGGQGHDILVRVRLLHGAIRQWMADSGRWDDDWDRPINQEDLAITLSLFSYWNIQSLVRMGIQLTDEQIASHHLLWRWAGHVLGIQDDLLTATFDEEAAQYPLMLKHQARPLECSSYAKTILDEVASGARRVPKATARRFLHQVTLYLIGDELAAGLEIKPQPRYWGVPALRLAGWLWSTVHNRVPGGEAFLYRGGSKKFREGLKASNKSAPIRYGVKMHDPQKLRDLYSAHLRTQATG